jgi:hypothetical protein
MDVEIMERAVDRFVEDLQKVWLDRYKAGGESMRHPVGQPGEHTGKPSTPGPETPPASIDDE